MSERKNDFLPSIYRDSTQANAILSAFENITDYFKNLTYDVVNQFCAGLATWALPDWEQDLGITPPSNATTDLRRALIKAKLMRPPTMTPAQIVAIANCFAPAKDVSIIDPAAPYTFKLVLPSQVPWIAEMMTSLEEAKPAHLAMNFELDRTDQTNLYVGTATAMGGAQTIGLHQTRHMDAAFFVGAAQRTGGVQTIMPHQTSQMTCGVTVRAIMRYGGQITVLPRGGI